MNFVKLIMLVMALQCVSCRLKLEYPPLHEAAVKGDVSEVKRLLSEGSSPNLEDERGENALCVALLYGHTDVAEVLYRSGADLNDKDSWGHTCLQLLEGSSYRAQLKPSIQWIRQKEKL